MIDISIERADLFNQLFLIGNRWQKIFYVHTPFCLRKCSYCIYGSKPPTTRDEIEIFFSQHIPRQIEIYKNVLEHVTFDQVYFGGGTPTIVDARTWEDFYNQVPHFRDIPLKATEISPFTVTDEHLELYRKYEFSYVSMGVQTLDKRVLEKENRIVVNREKINYICRRLDESDITSNVDLIFFLDTGGVKDLEITRGDLEMMLSTIRPVSLTLYYNYRSSKTLENREGMVQLVKEMLETYPEYRCVNSLLEESELEYDRSNSVEYRIMRKNYDFSFYMLPKVPQSFPYGYNMLSIGQYKHIKPRYNYYYVYDYMDKYSWKDCFNRAKELNLEFEQTREKLGLPHYNFTNNDGFFIDEAGKERFKEILKQAGYPYYDF